MDEPPAKPQGNATRRQLVIGGAVFAAILVALIAGYAWFLRGDYAVLAEGLRPAEASAIVAELDRRGTPYRLRDGGTTILVADGEVDATRVAIAGSDVAAAGQTGFELFNKSDMGLTNFAQKINYQRALQGELVRTIMQMDGVENARVHLALPERALFRDDRAEPSAAVTIAMKAGQTADAARVAGIQRLVAASVPELPAGKVIVLDADGRMISADAVVAPDARDRPADIEERAAVEQYYRARARAVIEQRMPGLKAAVRVSATPAGDVGTGAPWSPAGEGAARNFRLTVTIVTETTLNGEDQGVMRDAVVSALALDQTHGVALAFETGPTDVAVAAACVVLPVAAPHAETTPAPEPVASTVADGAITWGAAAALLVGLLAWLMWSRARPRLSPAEHEAFAQTLRRQLNLSGGAGDATR